MTINVEPKSKLQTLKQMTQSQEIRNGSRVGGETLTSVLPCWMRGAELVEIRLRKKSGELSCEGPALVGGNPLTGEPS